ncbi:FxsA family protein [Kineococcus arenarius]|uniref:FxsA family protein n=1 Tax=unclassified Kineococcus TaxID=2621656 RepID=UPI003D7E4518
MSSPGGPRPLPGRAGAGPVPARRGRWTAAVLLGVLLLLVVEVWLLSRLAEVVTAAGVLALLLVETAAGVLVLRRAGRRALQALRSVQASPVFPAGPAPGAHGAGRIGAGRIGDAALVGAGGALLVLPGVLSDVLALLCLLPPTRSLLRRLGARLVRARVRRALRRAGLDPAARAGRPFADGEVVEGEVLDDGVADGGAPADGRPVPRSALGPGSDPRPQGQRRDR